MSGELPIRPDGSLIPLSETQFWLERREALLTELTAIAQAESLIPVGERQFWLERRRARLTELAAIERAQGLPRSVATHQERRAAARRRGGEGEG